MDLPILIVIILVVLVGGSQLPKIARNVGLAGKEFRKAQQEAEEDAARGKGEAANKAPTIPPPVAIPPAPVAPTVGSAAPAAAAAPAEGTITLTPAQLDALLKAREAEARGQAATN